MAAFAAIVAYASPAGGDDGKAAAKLERKIPDLAQIRTDVLDPESQYYYPRLMDEYQRNDTLMDLEKFRYLYLGYMFQEDYNPYRSSAFSSQNDNLIEKKQISRQECDSVIKYAEKSLQDNPFDLKEMMNLISALRIKGKNNLAQVWQYKFNNILLAIASTGTGLDEESAWFVIEPQHEYILLNAMGYKVENHLFYEPYFEYITVVDPSGGKAGGYYFNIKTLLDEYYRKYPDDI